VTGAGAASWLFVPGSRPERFARAAAAGAHEVILDLEDAVAPAAKEAARAEAARWVTDGGRAWVRVNAVDTPWHDEDLAALVGRPGLRGLVVPKAEDPDVLRRIAESLPDGCGLLALVESAAGILRAPAVAGSPGVSGLAFGSIDFALDIDAAETDDALRYARSALVVAARAAGLPPPVDGVTVDTRDTDAVRSAAARARELGFGGKLCIHPVQVPTVNTVFAPDPADVAWARRVLAAAAGADADAGVLSVDGRMVDRPVVERARRLVDRAGG
jgi:citrate lyase subunit beta / citryl-CoA lyase